MKNALWQIPAATDTLQILLRQQNPNLIFHLLPHFGYLHKNYEKQHLHKQLQDKQKIIKKSRYWIQKPSAITPKPIIANITAMIMKTITAITAIAKAFNQPQSKKCLIKPSQTTNMIIDAIQPLTKASFLQHKIVQATAKQAKYLSYYRCLAGRNSDEGR